MKLSIETTGVMADLKALQAFDINAYGRVSALIKELHANQNTVIGKDLIDQLNMQGRDLNIDPKMIGNSLQIQNEKLNRNLWRLKLWLVNERGRRTLEPYRIIYGYFQVNQFRKIPEVRIFAVPCRANNKEDSYDYQSDHPITIRFRADYDKYI